MHWRSRIIHSQSKLPQGYVSLAPATYRGSTTVFQSVSEASDDWRQTEKGYTYGAYGTPTTLELGSRICDLEGARHTFITPGGQAAIALIYLSYARAGGHVLLPKNAYSPNRELGEGLMRRFNVTVERYDPLVGGAIAALIRPETCLIWCESPGSITMEVQDVPAIVKAAHEKGVPVALDNTYAAGVLFDAFSFGVDVSMQALTKYIGGHSDLLLGSVSAGTEEAYNRLGEGFSQLGMVAAPDDCSLALRGLQTLGVRLEALEKSTLTVANWLSQRPEIDLVLHPAFPSCPGHETWKRDFTGSASLFSIVFRPEIEPAKVVAFVDTLSLFKIGWSWGGVSSLAMAYPSLSRLDKKHHQRLVRLHIGLEDTNDLIDDLANALRSIQS